MQHSLKRACLLLTLIWLGGCASKGKYVWVDMPEFAMRPATEQKLMTDQSVLGVVRVRQEAASKPVAFKATEMRVGAGERMGFRMDDRAHLLALAGGAQYDLGPLSPEWKTVFWTTRRYVPPTSPFTKPYASKGVEVRANQDDSSDGFLAFLGSLIDSDPRHRPDNKRQRIFPPSGQLIEPSD